MRHQVSVKWLKSEAHLLYIFSNDIRPYSSNKRDYTRDILLTVDTWYEKVDRKRVLSAWHIANGFNVRVSDVENVTYIGWKILRERFIDKIFGGINGVYFIQYAAKSAKRISSAIYTIVIMGVIDFCHSVFHKND